MELKALEKSVPFREGQAVWLAGMIGGAVAGGGQDDEDEPCSPAVLLHGPPSSGKTHVAQAVLRHLGVTHAFVNCIEAEHSSASARHVYEAALQAIVPNYDSSSRTNTKIHCVNLNGFVYLLRKYVPRLPSSKFVLVLDKAERLRKMENNLLAGLLRLQEFSGVNVGVVLMSTLSWDSFCLPGRCQSVMRLRFPQYTQDQLMGLLLRDCPPEITSQHYQAYLRLLLSVFHMICCDLTDLKHLAKKYFPVYRAPVDRGEAEWSNSRLLWQNLQPHLRQGISKTFKVKGLQEEKLQALQLPYHMKFLLISAFLASYNPPKADRRLFLKNSGRQKKRRKPIPVGTSMIRAGPRHFPLERLMAIFRSVSGLSVRQTGQLHSHVASLVTLKLLSQTGKHITLDTPRYKCTVNIETARQISQTVEFELDKFLYEGI